MQQRQRSDWPQGTTRMAPRTPGRSARSREGCLTCKRRKVKCDEQRPRCSHCERLNLECKWRPPGGSQGGHTGTTSSASSAMVASRGGSGSNSSSGGIATPINTNGTTAGVESTSMALKQLQLPVTHPARRPPTIPNGHHESIRQNNSTQHLQQIAQTHPTHQIQNGQQQNQAQIQTPAAAPPHQVAQTPGTFGQSINGVNQIFDFASFMWDAEDVWQEIGPDAGLGVVGAGGGMPTGMQNNGTHVLGFTDNQMQDNNMHVQNSLQTQQTSHTQQYMGHDQQQQQFQLPQHNSQHHHHQNQSSISEPSTVPDSTGMADDPSSQVQTLGQVPAENYRLMDYFTHAVIPPILAEVETQNKWLVMRRVLVGRANASRMVRWAILAFSNVILTQREGAWLESPHNHYENALAEVVATMGEISPGNAHGTSGNGLSPGTTAGSNIEGRTSLPTVTSPDAGVHTDGSGATSHGTGHATSTSARANPDNEANSTNTNPNSSRAQNPAANNNTPTISLTQPSVQRENLLATLFFLSYVDILRGRIEAAHSNLKRAHRILQINSSSRAGIRPGDSSTDKASTTPPRFSAVEHQFLLWLRLLDARAVSAGGEGLFLSHDDEVMLVETPPPAGGLRLEGPDSVEGANVQSSRARGPSDDDDIEDVLFQILYRPGIVFFQKVQSFMGRISRIDPWHRSRGTVEDEIEVMNIGASIASDLRALYESRPSLMDYAVTGRLTAAHVSAHLAMAITRSFRTYLCNYYASKVHLHRVAYKSLPLTTEAADALAQIRRLARLLVEGLDTGLGAAGADHEALPVNMLWPLLMLGSEETDTDERLWIHTQILRMQAVAGNSRITAQVLKEVQARQDATKTRVDIRSVMHDIFNSSFAIV